MVIQGGLLDGGFEEFREEAIDLQETLASQRDAVGADLEKAGSLQFAESFAEFGLG